MVKRQRKRGVDSVADWGGLINDDEPKRQRSKARELRRSQWWKRRLSRGRCYYCDQPIPPGELTMDHVVPLARGGQTTKSNVVPACKECNTKKQQLVPVEWQEYLDKI